MSIKPNHDFMGIIGIQTTDGIKIFGVLPRFWNNSIPKEEVDNIQLLKQNQASDLENKKLNLEKALNQKFKNIQEVLSTNTSEEGVHQVEDKKQVEDNNENDKLNHHDALRAVYRLCKLYSDEKNIDKQFKMDLKTNPNGFPIFLFERFVEALRPHLRELRRSYRQVIDEVGSVRGKITQRGMINIVARPSSRIECQFETFDTHSPIYRILATTLDIIIKTKIPYGFTFLQNEFQSILKKAAALRKRLKHIPIYRIPTAIKECQRVRSHLPRAFRNFSKILSMAERILRKQYDSEKESKNPRTWWHITAPSSKVWELLLEMALKDENPNIRPETQEELKGPWKGSGTKNIDICFTDKDNNTFLIDAKYAPWNKTPSSGYQYQQFFYSVAFNALPTKENERHLRSMLLIHAAKNDEQRHETYEIDPTLQQFFSIPQEAEQSLQERFRYACPPLKVSEVLFPQCHHLLTEEALNAYLEQTKVRLREVLT